MSIESPIPPIFLPVEIELSWSVIRVPITFTQPFLELKHWSITGLSLDEYKNLGVYKNYCVSFNVNIDQNIGKNL